MQITKQQIEALKGKCYTSIDHSPLCTCKGSGNATITIPKEWVECPECERHERECSHEGCEYECKLNCDKGKIPKYKVGDNIWADTECKPYTHLGDCEHKIKLKIISETETTQTLVMA